MPQPQALKNYFRDAFRGDLIAGLTTAVMLIPQAMAYALLAGLPPIVGLYAATVPLVAYAVCGSSRQLAVGPVAMDSLLTAATVGAIAQSGTVRYLELATLLALMVGAVQLALGLVRGGFLVNFLSKPAISGFTSAAALIIAASQLGLLLGLNLPRSTSVFTTAQAVLQQATSIHPTTALLSAGAIAALWALKRWAPRWPRALIVVVVGAVLAGLGGLADAGVAVVGHVPAGLPSPRLPHVDVETVRALGTGALTIAFIAFLEAISVSTKLSERTRESIDANRELVALGAANLAAGFFRGYPVAGGFSRTAVNADAGARTKMAGVVTATAVALTLAFFTDLLTLVPKASLGAIIVAAVTGLIDIREPFRLFRVKRNDFITLVVTFTATLVLGIQQGILVGVGLSLLLFIVRTARPHTAVLGRLPGTEVYRNVLRFAEAQPIAGVLILRLDAQFYFGNVNFLKQTLAELEAQQAEPLHAVIIDASGVNQIDSSAEAALCDILRDYRERGVQFMLATVKGPVRDVLERSGFTERLGPENITLRVHDAVKRLGLTTET